MSPLPNYRPQQLSLGPLEKEILHIIWELGSVTVKDVHERVLADLKRQLASASVTTILNRLTKKGWLTCNKESRNYRWQPQISKQEAQILQAYDCLHQFLAVGNPDVVAAFADSLDRDSVEKFEAIAQKIQAFRVLKQDN
ncbi:BlaI/MecI/CopY family transcriptional regulator [Nostocaceae cyanobacterium CENA369]|uniref:BlaI/MecI/CopY family transcriptional regulator n=1 Tax=Dendronalium phyllosphericum CENA369 TaxID=1725256 RepID=A0A8J7IFZ5_9NOST|nr:BlaI/MecI/CopY family transcriptional regulator [Dendronalium phyllosphericum]MBH8576642.1 BlaI/MecI/CopY family transcriptional regulator [Dendronalium phyllosphericum CENA369]